MVASFPEFPINSKQVLKTFAYADSGDMIGIATSPDVPRFTLYDPTGTVVSAFNSVAATYQAGNASVLEVSYNTDFTGLLEGDYTVEFIYWKTSVNTSQTTKNIDTFQITLSAAVPVPVPSDVIFPLTLSLSNEDDFFVLSLNDVNAIMYMKLADNPPDGEESSLTLVGVSSSILNLRPKSCNNLAITNQSVTIQSGSINEVSYQFSSNDMSALLAIGPGLYVPSVKLTFPSGLTKEAQSDFFVKVVSKTN